MPNSSVPLPLVGWPLLPLPDSHGQMPYPSLEASVRESIQIILRTRPGEQLMRPDFGAGLADFLQDPNTLTTRRRIRDRLMKALEQWERRLIISRVDVAEVPGNLTQIRVDIAYRLRRTGAPGSLGLTMDLEG